MQFVTQYAFTKDLSASSYRLDFYIWFRFDPSKISLDDVKEFEFVNGFPTKYEVKADAEHGYLEYRVRGDFIKTFDFSRYPFEIHKLTVELEHKKTKCLLSNLYRRPDLKH